MRLYLDACAIIHGIEGGAGVRQVVQRFASQADAAPAGLVMTSRLSRLECRVKPLRDGALDRLVVFDAFFARRRLLLAEVSAGVIERATELRAQHGFKTPDAIHLATALIQFADVFLTGDASLQRCPGLQVEVLDPSLP